LAGNVRKWRNRAENKVMRGGGVNFLSSLQKNVNYLLSFLFLMIFFKYFWQDNHDVEIKQPRRGDLELKAKPNPNLIPISTASYDVAASLQKSEQIFLKNISKPNLFLTIAQSTVKIHAINYSSDIFVSKRSQLRYID
jgi:hypothetical protein